MALHIALVEPQIPPNTGNIARLCAVTGTSLHLVEPLGFSLAGSEVKRAGLDYWSEVTLHRHIDLNALYSAYPDARFVYLTTKSERPSPRSRKSPGCDCSTPFRRRRYHD